MEHLKCFSEKILLRALRFIWRARTHISASTQLHRADQQQRDQSNSLCSETFYLVWESWTFIMNCSSVCSCEDHLQFLYFESDIEVTVWGIRPGTLLFVYAGLNAVLQIHTRSHCCCTQIQNTAFSLRWDLRARCVAASYSSPHACILLSTLRCHCRNHTE